MEKTKKEELICKKCLRCGTTFETDLPNMVNCRECYKEITAESTKKLVDLRSKVDSYNSFVKEINPQRTIEKGN